MDDDVKQTLKTLFTARKDAAYKLFLALFIISAVTCIFALRHNNETMIKLRSQVYAADKADGDVNAALNNLRSYVYGHMNTNLSSGGNTIKPPIQLQYTYERLVSQAQKSANNTGLYTAAENYCQAKIPTGFSGRYRIACVQDYIMNHGGAPVAAIPPALYEFDFVSPTWSPDLAGWSLVASVVFFVAYALGFLKQKFF